LTTGVGGRPGTAFVMYIIGADNFGVQAEARDRHEQGVPGVDGFLSGQRERG